MSESDVRLQRQLVRQQQEFLQRQQEQLQHSQNQQARALEQQEKLCEQIGQLGVTYSVLFHLKFEILPVISFTYR